MFAFLTLDFALKNWRALAVAVGVIALIAFGSYERLKGYSAGKTAAVEKIEKANELENARATSAAKTVDDCFAAGGDWDRAAGVCKPAAGQ